MAIEKVVEGVAEEVASNLEEAATATRAINPQAVGYFFGGVCVGAVVGFIWGYRFNKEKIRAEAFKQSEEEIEKIREVYQQKTVAAQAQAKPSVEEVIEERGYSVHAPESPQRPTRPSVVVREPSDPAPTVVYDGGKDKDRAWDYETELEARTDEHPYIIHQDEFNEDTNGYPHVTMTYFAQDSVLVDEDNHPVPHPDLVVGRDNLRFGHGSDDIDVVFVRNDRLEQEMEICRLPGSYEEEVLGLNRNDSDTD